MIRYPVRSAKYKFIGYDNEKMAVVIEHEDGRTFSHPQVPHRFVAMAMFAENFTEGFDVFIAEQFPGTEVTAVGQRVMTDIDSRPVEVTTPEAFR